MKTMTMAQLKNSTAVPFSRLLEVLSPELAARWAAERFLLSPAPLVLKGEEMKRLAEGHRFSVRHRRRHLAAWSWGDGPTIYCLHGWGGRGAQFHKFVEPLVAAGFSVVAFDAPGSGDTGGSYASPVAFAAALTDVVREVGPAHGVIAHSMGAAAAVLALRQGLEVPRAVLVSCPAGVNRFSRGFAERLGLSEDTRFRMQERLERRLGVAWNELSVIRSAREMKAGLLLVHDEQDRSVPWEEAKAISERWPGAELMLTRSLGHTRILSDAEVVSRVVEFLRTAK